MDKLREEFEGWFNKEMVLHISTSNETVVRLMWKAWQASRANIVVDLEEPDSYMTADGTRLAYKSYIRSIGLSIKGE